MHDHSLDSPRSAIPLSIFLYPSFSVTPSLSLLEKEEQRRRDREGATEKEPQRRRDREGGVGKQDLTRGG